WSRECGARRSRRRPRRKASTAPGRSRLSGYSTVDRAADTAARSAEDEALRWLADFDNLSEVEQARFHAWLDERPENGEAFEKLEAEWRRLDALRQLATAEPDPRVVEKWLRLRRFRRRYLPRSEERRVGNEGRARWT